MTLNRTALTNHLRAIKTRGRPVALMLNNHGRIERYDAGSGMHDRALAAGAEWVGTYLRTATVEMVAEDLRAVGVEVSL